MIRKLLILTLLVSLVNCSNKKKDNSNQNLLLLLALNSQQKSSLALTRLVFLRQKLL